ncbi:hypothetical protein BG004_000454 [Podila humilis]|nr:hypothetical protein BG004_000454 [Podila humilis]
MDIPQAERQKYAEIFSSLNPINGYITGVQAQQVFMNSGLPVVQLGHIWDICDIDGDGNMDFDEFCLALRFMNASISGEISEIPTTLPAHMIPASKAQYFGGGQGYNQSYMNHNQNQKQSMQNQAPNYGAISDLDTSAAASNNLSDDFEWYIAPSDRSNYESIYKNNVQMSTGEVRMGQFEELYQALQIPREDIHAAWSLVNVHGAPQIGKEQCIMFFHILNSRRLGKRVPSTLPGALRTSFLGDSNYAMSDNYAVNEIRQQAGRPSVPMSFATKSAFSSQKGHAMADDYLSRLNQKESAASETHAQEDRLRNELEHLKRQIEDAEARSRSTRGDTSVAKKELQELLAYKQQQVLNDDPSILDRELLDQDREIQRQRDALKQLDRRVSFAIPFPHNHVSSNMSRLIIKNLPKHLTDERFREHFGTVGEVTDAKLMKSSFGNSRRFGFIGYRTEKEAKAAVSHFNNTFIDTSKIIVEKAKEIGDTTLPRAWSQHSVGTSAHARKVGVERQHKEAADAALKQKRDTEASLEMKKKQDHLAKLYQAENDPKLKEYLEVMQPRAVTKTWANDDAVELNTEKVGHGRENNRTKARAQVVALKNRKPGGEGLMVTQTKITFDDSDDELYDNLPTKAAEKDEDAEMADIEMSEAPKEDTLVNSNEVSDLDWLKSRMQKPAEEPKDEASKKEDNSMGDPASDSESAPAPPPPKIAQEPPKRPVIISAEEEEEIAKNLIADTGRLFVRNLPYTCTENDLRGLFEKFGPLSEVHMPIAKDTKKPKGYAYILYLLPEHAIKAFTTLDKKFFMGRLLHIIASKEKPQPKEDEESALGPGGRPLSVKKQRELKKKGQSGMDFNWNSLYMNSDAIAASIADRLNVSKADILNPDADNMGVRLAVAETQIIMETKKFLEEEGINVDAFGKKERSDTVILVKNIPFNTSEQDLHDLFGTHGDLGRVLMPPAKTIAIVEFLQPSEARSAFSHLAYRRFKDTILYLEKAPVGVFNSKYDPEMKNKKAEKTPSGGDDDEAALTKKLTSTQLMDSATTSQAAQDTDNMEGATLFIKNINFKTTDEGLKKAFASVDGIKSTMIRHKPDPKNAGKSLSMGFGFAEFLSKDKAVAAMRAMNGFVLDGSKLEIKFSDRTSSSSKSATKARVAPKDHGTKLLIRNIPFEATKKDIQGLFSTFGQLKSVRIPKKMNGGHRGFAFLDFMTKQEAKSVYENVANTHLLGRHLVVEWAEEEAGLEVLREKVGRQFRKDDGSGGKRRKVDLDGDDEDMMMEDD